MARQYRVLQHKKYSNWLHECVGKLLIQVISPVHCTVCVFMWNYFGTLLSKLRHEKPWHFGHHGIYCMTLRYVVTKEVDKIGLHDTISDARNISSDDSFRGCILEFKEVPQKEANKTNDDGNHYICIMVICHPNILMLLIVYSEWPNAIKASCTQFTRGLVHLISKFFQARRLCFK
mgnify:CR=1 FL=1